MRIREILLEHRSRPDILEVLDQEFPLPSGRWADDRLSRAIRRIQKGAPGIEPLPAGLLEKPDMTPVMALVETGRKNGKTWREIADELNAAGFRPVRAPTFSLFQVMELARRRWGRAHPRTESVPKSPTAPEAGTLNGESRSDP